MCGGTCEQGCSEWCSLPGQLRPRDGEINIRNGRGGGEIFCAQKVLNYLIQIKENSINNCDFLKFIIPLKGGECHDWSRAPKYLSLLGSSRCVTSVTIILNTV
jgi:hypothetical protein